MSYVDFSISGIEGNPNIAYEIFLTEKEGNTLDSKYIRVYLTDENNNYVAGASTYTTLTNTSYRPNRNNGKLVYKGDITGNQTIDNLNNTTTYGTGFTYDENGFTLTEVKTGKSWSNNHEELIGTYTCKETATSCSTIYQIGRYIDNNNATGAKASSIYGNDVIYANGIYKLKGTTSTTQNNPDTNHHYVCNTEENTLICKKVRYYISYASNVYRYIILENGETIEDAVYNMTGYKQGQTVDANLNAHKPI